MRTFVPIIAAMLVGVAIGMIQFAFGETASAPQTGPFGGPTYLASVPPSNAFDGAAETYWQGSYNTDESGAASPFTATSWTLGYGFTAARSVTRVEVDFAVDSRFVATGASVACSPDGSSWTTVGTLPAGQTPAVTISPAAACLDVEVVMGTPGTGYTPAVAEVRISSAALDAPPPPPATPPPTANPSQPNPTKVAAVGDSITAGSYGPFPYTALLPIWTPATVTNAGVSGDTTEGMLARMPTMLSASPQMVLIMGGTNDCQFGWPSSRSLTALASIVAQTEAANAEAVLIGPIPRGGTTDAGASYVPCLLALHDATRDWARGNGVPFVDPWADFESFPGSGLPAAAVTVDGTHPSGRGAFLLARDIARGLGWGFPGD